MHRKKECGYARNRPFLKLKGYCALGIVPLDVHAFFLFNPLTRADIIVSILQIRKQKLRECP